MIHDCRAVPPKWGEQAPPQPPSLLARRTSVSTLLYEFAPEGRESIAEGRQPLGRRGGLARFTNATEAAGDPIPGAHAPRLLTAAPPGLIPKVCLITNLAGNAPSGEAWQPRPGDGVFPRGVGDFPQKLENSRPSALIV